MLLFVRNISALLALPMCFSLFPYLIYAGTVGAEYYGKVTHVTDGDTVVISLSGSEVKITCRLYGIDAPEKYYGNRIGQPYGDNARVELQRLVGRNTVSVTTTGEKTYGREVCRIKKYGKSINLELVRRGYAWAYIEHLHEPYRSDYIEAEKKARSSKLGLWSQDKPVAPWEFKKRYWK